MIDKTARLISYLGLCGPADETNEEKVSGVMPYIALKVEVLEGLYNKNLDIYALLIMWELSSDHQVNHD